jgi:hypothetical protein
MQKDVKNGPDRMKVGADKSPPLTHLTMTVDIQTLWLGGGGMTGIALSDMRHVLWGPTFKLAAARSVASAFVLTLVGLMTGVFEQASVGQIIQFFLSWSVFASVGGICYMYMLKGISVALTPVAGGIVSLTCSLMSYLIAALVACGDPLVYLAAKKFPELLPVQGFGPFNLKVIIFVLDEERMAA